MRTEGQTETVGDPYRKQWESVPEHIFLKSPTLSTQIRERQSFPYEHRQEAAQKRRWCFPESRDDAGVPGFVFTLTAGSLKGHGASQKMSLPYFSLLSKYQEL